MKKFLISLLAFFSISSIALAYDGDLSINGTDISFSSGNFLEGNTVRIYASVSNLSNRDLLGVVRFYANDRQIGGDQAISIFRNRTDDVFVDWTPLSYGDHQIAVKVFPWDTAIDNPANNWITRDIFVVQDTDHDGLPNDEDPDDDNDGSPDEEDHFPLDSSESVDTDGDGIGDNTDTDDDNDDVPDEFDDLPLDPNETIDTDKDGLGNIKDPDDDGDNLDDQDEEHIGTDPLDPDTDKDGTQDGDDAFPLDPSETTDTDKDGIGNNTDTDDDNDGIPDSEDSNPLNKGPEIHLRNKDFTIGLLENHTFDASPSYDEDGRIVSFVWNINGEEIEGNSITYSFDKLGTQTVSLTITDDQGESRNSQFQVNVVNLKLYGQLIATLIAILLALLIFFKYISGTKNRAKDK